MSSTDDAPRVSRAGNARSDGRAPSREPALDGLRAMAALMVALLHCLFAIGMPSELREHLVSGPAGAVTNGTSAVILFFVLSGYVLAGSFSREVSWRATAAFLARRLLRIYPAWVVAVATAWLASFLYPALAPGPGVGSALHESMAAQPEAAEVLRHMAVPGMAGLLLPQGWTIPIELALSFALPILFLLAFALRGGLLLAAAAVGLTVFDAPPVEYAFPFVVGMLASVRLRRNVANARLDARSALLLVSALVVFFLPSHMLGSLSTDFRMAMVSTSAVVLMELVRRVDPLRHAFGSRLAARLGEISYGFYLVHYTVVSLAAPLMFTGDAAATPGDAVARWLALAAVVVPVSAALAAASWKWIEAPAIAAGRRLGRLRRVGRED